jgi:WD40 repeat protein
MTSSYLQEVVLTGSAEDESMHLWEMHTATTLVSYRPASPSSYASAVPVGRDLFAVSQPGKPALHVFNWRKDMPQARMSLPERIVALAASSDGAHVLGGGEGGRLFLWEVAGGAMLKTWEAHYRAVSVIAFTDDGSHILTGSEDSMVPTPSDRPRRAAPHTTSSRSCLIRPRRCAPGQWGLFWTVPLPPTFHRRRWLPGISTHFLSQQSRSPPDPTDARRFGLGHKVCVLRWASPAKTLRTNTETRALTRYGNRLDQAAWQLASYQHHSTARSECGIFHLPVRPACPPRALAMRDSDGSIIRSLALCGPADCLEFNLAIANA